MFQHLHARLSSVVRATIAAIRNFFSGFSLGSSSDQTSYEHASNEHTSGERLLAMMHDGIAIVDHTGRLEWANEPFALLIGNSLKELKNRPLMTYICPESRSTFEKFLLPHLNPGKLSDVQEAKECEISLCGRTGQDIWFLAMASPLLQSPSSPSSSFQDSNAFCQRILLIDISNRKRLETQLLQLQKMDSFGRAAIGIAHDFNNLVTVILGHAELLRQYLPSPPSSSSPSHPHMSVESIESALSNIEQIERASERAMSLARQLLSLGRRPPIAKLESIHMARLLEDMRKMLERLVLNDIQLTIVADADLWNVRVDPGQLEQMIVNLVINARDAMKASMDGKDGKETRGGQLSIEARNQRIDNPPLDNPQLNLDGSQDASVPPDLLTSHASTHVPVPTGHYVALSIRDTGIGIAQEELGRIFEPFFTTKPAGRGTGLGLWMVDGMVKQFHGFLRVESEPSKGSTFTIYLPAGNDDVLTKITTPAKDASPIAMVPLQSAGT